MHSTQERPPSFFSNPFQPSQGTQHFELHDQEDYNRYEQPLTLGGNRNNVQPHTPEEVVLDFIPNSVDTVANPRANVTDREPATTTATILDVTEPNLPLQPLEPVHDPVTEQNLLEKVIKSILKEVVKWNIVNMATFIMILSAIKWKFSYMSVLVVLWLYNTYNIVTLSHATLRNSRTNKRMNMLAIFNNILSVIFKVLIVIQVETNKMSVTIPLVPLLISEISLSLAKYLRYRKSSVSFFYQVEIAFKLFVILQAAIFALKVDNIIDWNWREVLCIYWILFAVMVGITFAFVIMLIGKCCTYLFAEMEVYEVRGVIWLVAVIGGKTILSYLLVRRVLKVLNREKNIEFLMGIMATISVYSLGLALYTIFFYNGIEELWKKVAAIGVVFTEEEVIMSEKQLPSPKKEPEKIEIPKFLTKFSGTYFRRATGDEIQKVKDKKKKEGEDAKPNKNNNNNNNNPNKQMKNRRRQNSLDTSKSRANYSNNTTNIGLLTVHETEGERTKTIEWNNTSRFGLRIDKGRDFFANFTDRSGVSGIIPSSSAINSKTDRYQVDGLASNDSYLLPPTSKDTEVPTKFVRPNRKKDFTADNGADLSPGERRDRADIIEESFEGGSLQADVNDVHFRRVQSMQDISPTQVISLSEALESPKVKNSVIPDHPEPLMSPVSEGSKEVQCLICFDNPPDAVFMECGHGGVCYECSLEIWKTTGECYLCRNKINQVLQVDIKTKLGNNVIKVLSSTQMVLYDEDNE